MGMTKANVFEPILEEIKNEDIKAFAEYLIENECVDYFYEIGASSTAKYHPAFSLGELGLARHTCALIKFLIWIIDLEYIKEQITSRERDLLIIAGMVHDWRKLGEANDVQKYTVFNHPILAADMIRKYEGEYLLEGEIEFIAECCERHMGEWSSDRKSDAVLPKPENHFHYFLHLADYLSSRKILDMEFDDWEKPELPALDTYILTFGRYDGQKLVDVAKKDKSYIEWLKADYGREPVRSLVKLL